MIAQQQIHAKNFTTERITKPNGFVKEGKNKLYFRALLCLHLVSGAREFWGSMNLGKFTIPLVLCVNQYLKTRAGVFGSITYVNMHAAYVQAECVINVHA